MHLPSSTLHENDYISDDLVVMIMLRLCVFITVLGFM